MLIGGTIYVLFSKNLKVFNSVFNNRVLVCKKYDNLDEQKKSIKLNINKIVPIVPNQNWGIGGWCCCECGCCECG